MNDDDDGLAATFEAIRPRLVGVAHGSPGSMAEDVVQDAGFRLGRASLAAEACTARLGPGGPA
ncbi:sigma-70 family RNA polymerase sigma factor family protein [Streptosporangium soli]|nr:hypothetical protein [Streptosporangium sp. KLBMP 9127]